MLSVATRKLLFWITVLTVMGSVAMLVRPPTCGDMDPRAYLGLFALGPVILVIDAVMSIVRQRARDFSYRGGYADGVKQVSVYDVSELSGRDAVALGRTRLIFPGITLLLFLAFVVVFRSSGSTDGFPRC